MKSAPSRAARDARYLEKKEARGLTLLRVWVPTERLAAIKRMIAAYLKRNKD